MAEPAIVPHNGGEVISDHDRKRVEILADTEQIVITESWYVAGERGPDPHVHHHHVDAFYILEGTIVFGVGPRVVEEVAAAAGTLVLVPPDVVHTFWNPGPDRASYLNYHAPNGRFAEFLRAARDGRRYEWDSYDAPADGGLPAEDAVVRGPGEGEVVVLSETSAILKAESADAGGRFSAVETTLAPGYAGPGPHVHESFVDSFYVLEGTMAMRVGDEHRTLGAGDFALAPPGTVHTFANESESPVRMLNVLAPAGFERYLKELSALGDRPDQAATAALASKYDFRAAG
jgi:mannose-6-phosphate isomerase-like protein (cupin superfamily)